MDRAYRSVLALAIAASTACGLDFDRFDPADESAVPEGASDDGVDATRAPTSDAAADASSADASSHESGLSDPCPPSPGTIVAPAAPGPVTIDGDLGDWGSPTFTTLDIADAQFILGATGACNASTATATCQVPSSESAQFALMWDEAHLYVGVSVMVPGVGGTNASVPYDNDAVEIYLGGDSTPTGDYSSVDQQYFIDWQNTVSSCGSSCTQRVPPGVVSAVRVAADKSSYVVEAQIQLAEVGVTAPQPGKTFGFDLGIDHGQGSNMTRSLLVWWKASHAAATCSTQRCRTCNPDQPYCDTLAFGLLCMD